MADVTLTFRTTSQPEGDDPAHAEPGNVVVTGQPGESLFEIGRRNGVAIATSCNGKASCGLCRVVIVAGEEGLTPLGPLEKRHLGNVYFITKQRLSCQARLTAGATAVTVDVP